MNASMRRLAVRAGAIVLVFAAAAGFALTMDGQSQPAPNYVPAERGPDDFEKREPKDARSIARSRARGEGIVERPSSQMSGNRPTARCVRLVREPAVPRPGDVARIRAVGHPDEMAREWSSLAVTGGMETIPAQ